MDSNQPFVLYEARKSHQIQSRYHGKRFLPKPWFTRPASSRSPKNEMGQAPKAGFKPVSKNEMGQAPKAGFKPAPLLDTGFSPWWRGAPINPSSRASAGFSLPKASAILVTVLVLLFFFPIRMVVAFGPLQPLVGCSIGVMFLLFGNIIEDEPQISPSETDRAVSPLPIQRLVLFQSIDLMG